MTVDYDLADPLLIRDASAGRFTSRSWMPFRQALVPAENGAPRRGELARIWNLLQLEGKRPSLYRGKGRIGLNVVDLFCGCGGLSIGVKQAMEAVGVRPVFALAADLSRSALDVYAKNLRPLRTACENVENLVDYRLRTDGDRSLPDMESVYLSRDLSILAGDIDVFLAGPPCEGNSNLNNRTRRIDSRNELYLDAVVAGIALGAKVMVIENVPAVKRSKQNVVARALSLLGSAGYRIDNNEFTLTASDYGTPQERRRHFLIAAKSEQSIMMSDLRRLQIPAPTASDALTTLANVGRDTTFDRPSRLSPENEKRVQFLVEREEYDLPDDERPDCHRLKNHNYLSVYGRMRPNQVAPTITTGFLSPGRGRFTHPSEPRSLTPHEGAKLQGFGEDFDWLRRTGTVTRSGYANMIGSAVPPQLGFVVGMGAVSLL